MRDFIITIPVDEDLSDALKCLGLKLLGWHEKIAEDIASGELPDFRLVNHDEGIEYPFDLELTAIATNEIEAQAMAIGSSEDIAA